MAKFAVILPAAGRSSRFTGTARKKVFAELHGRAVWLRAVDIFEKRKDVAQILLVLAADDRDWFREKYQANLAFSDVQLVTGGAERVDSVAAALALCKPEIDYVSVHDAARPLIEAAAIDRVFAAAQEHGAALLASPITSTIKRVDSTGRITETVPRNELWAAQTPQVARRDWMEAAFAQRAGLAATDEAQLLEQAGFPVQAVTGPPWNLKITTADDLKLAAALWPLVPRDIPPSILHPFADEEPRPL